MGGLLVIALLAVTGIVVLVGTARGLLRRRAVARLLRRPPALIGELREGQLARIEGRVSAEDTPLLRSPIEERPCVGYYVGVDYFDVTRHHVPRWFPVAEETAMVPFRVVGDDGAVLDVDASSIDIEICFIESGRVLDPPRDRVRPILRRNDRRSAAGRNLSYVEVAIEPGARVSLIGRVLRPASGGGGAYRRSAHGAALGPLRDGDAIRLDVKPRR
ncbi:MAG: hypothetical protein KC619_05515 [Myxococcales bacterium]|nr:hypothetical protein [Myxococcales bacterium]